MSRATICRRRQCKQVVLVKATFRSRPTVILLDTVVCSTLLVVFLSCDTSRHSEPAQRNLGNAAGVDVTVAGGSAPAPTMQPGFPDQPPIAGADPSVGQQVFLRVPTRLKVGRGPETLSVGIDPATLVMTNITVGAKMESGVEMKLFVCRNGDERPESSEVDRASELEFDLQPSVLQAKDLPSAKACTVEIECAAFESDVPAQHSWDPGSDNYKVLWNRALKQTVELRP